MRRARRITGVSLGLLLSLVPGCGDDGGDGTAESLGDDPGTSDETTTDGTGTDGTSTDGTSTDGTDTGTDTSTGTSTGTDTSTAPDTSTDSGTDTGDVCDPSAFHGVALANDGWGEGDLCDAVWVCADEAQAQALAAVVPGVQCVSEPGVCPVLTCYLLQGGMILDADDVAAACAALGVRGIDVVYCLVLGP